MARLKIRNVLLVLISAILLIIIIVNTKHTSGYHDKILDDVLRASYKLKLMQLPEKEIKLNRYQVIQIGLVCVTQQAKINLYTMLKSLFFYRNSPIHFHVVVNQETKKSLGKLFDTWAMPQVNISFYNIRDIDPNNEFTDNPNVLRVVLPSLIKFQAINKIILLSTDVVFNEDIFELWNEFKFFQNDQILGIPLERENETDKNQDHQERANADVVLYHLKNLRNYGWNRIWNKAKDQHIFEYNELNQTQIILSCFKMSRLEHSLPCGWNSRSIHCGMDYKVVNQNLEGEMAQSFVSSFMTYDGNEVRKVVYNCESEPPARKFKKPMTDKCFYFPESEIHQRRILSYFYEYVHVPNATDDVTIVTQLSFDRLNVIEELAARWEGPISISFYLTDTEYIKCREFINKSDILKNRLNIGYHVVFKAGVYYNINYLRNVALSEVNTPYVFIDDVDLLPMKNLYMVIKLHIRNFTDMNKKALIIPAFETRKLNVPSTVEELLNMLKKKEVVNVQPQNPKGHGPTNYAKWKTAIKTYRVIWQFRYEPYVVVKSDVIKYDERFFAYGWDKISHIMELEAQGYEFHVLPNAFIVHKFHRTSMDKKSFLTSSKYKRCLRSLKDQWAKDVEKKYGRKFILK